MEEGRERTRLRLLRLYRCLSMRVAEGRAALHAAEQRSNVLGGALREDLEQLQALHEMLGYPADQFDRDILGQL